MKKAGRKPFGYFDDEAAVIEQVFLKAARRPHGVKPTFQGIADSMNKDGYKTQTGGPWYAIAVGRILRKGRQPAAGPKQKKIKKQHLDSGDYLTKEEVVSCRAVLRDSDRVLFEVLLGAGLRASECCELAVQDLGILAGRSQIDVRRGKGSRQRAVKIGPKLKQILMEYIIKGLNTIYKTSVPEPVFRNERGKPLTYSDLYSRIRKIRTRSGVAALHPHALRHTFGTFLYNYRKDLEYVRQQLGHASIATTQIYINTLSEEKLEQMRGFEGSFDP
jgi:site-specific recombinase XerD